MIEKIDREELIDRRRKLLIDMDRSVVNAPSSEESMHMALTAEKHSHIPQFKILSEQWFELAAIQEQLGC